MAGKHKCIVCSNPIGKDGYLGTIKGISAAFCRQHAGSCKRKCDSCFHAPKCPVCNGMG